MDSAKNLFYDNKRKEKVNKIKPSLRTSISMDSNIKPHEPKIKPSLRTSVSMDSNPYQNNKPHKPKQQTLTRTLSRSSSSSSSFRFTPSYSSETMESLLAELFASASSIKAAYVQLQSAESPYDAASIQSADLAIVKELRHVSGLKRAFVNRSLQLSSPLQSKFNEEKNLLKTYELTLKKHQSDVEQKDSELISLQTELSHLNLKCRKLEMKAYPGKTLASLHGLHLSGLNPTHFLCALRYAVRSIRKFVRLMVQHMIDAGWDLDAAVKAVHTGTVLKNSAHQSFYFESYVCNIMFSDFHHKDFNLESLKDRETRNSTEFFDTFISLESFNIKELLLHRSKEEKFTTGFKVFLSAKYLSMVQPRMELSFFKDLNQRDKIKSCNEFPNSDWFMCFAEMARRVWLLHCLYFSFEPEMKASIFQIRRGARFSEVYMENIVAEENGGNGKVPTTYRDKRVGFTVIPGFRVGMTLIQARVYLSGVD